MHFFAPALPTQQVHSAARAFLQIQKATVPNSSASKGRISGLGVHKHQAMQTHSPLIKIVEAFLPCDPHCSTARPEPSIEFQHD